MGYEVEVRVTRGERSLVLTHQVEGPDFDMEYGAIREAVRDCADVAAKAFQDPKSPYSDDLFKLQRGRIVDAKKVTDDDDIPYDNQDY